MNTPMTFTDWEQYGQQQGWISQPICSTHDSTATNDELDLFENGDDPCIFVYRAKPYNT